MLMSLSARYLTFWWSMSRLPIFGIFLLLLAASAVSAELPSDGTRSAAYAIAMHGQPALPADFSHLSYASPQARKALSTVQKFFR